MGHFPGKALFVSAILAGTLVSASCTTVQGEPIEPVSEALNTETQFVTVNGQRTAYKTYGEGAPLLMVQRFRGAMDDWDPALIETLASEREVIVFDNSGVGESDGEVAETLEGAADVAAGLLDALGHDSADILGWSMGGMTAQVFAIKYPAKTTKLVLAGTLPPAGTTAVRPSPDEWNMVATKADYTPEDIVFLFYTETQAGRDAAEQSRVRLQSLDDRGVAAKTSPSIIMPQVGAVRRFIGDVDGWYGRLSEINAPVLIANGDADRAFAIINSVVLHEQIPNSQLAVYPDAGHAFLFQYADRFGRDVLAFLDE